MAISQTKRNVFFAIMILFICRAFLYCKCCTSRLNSRKCSVTRIKDLPRWSSKFRYRLNFFIAYLFMTEQDMRHAMLDESKCVSTVSKICLHTTN